jgi:HlyD family secretion protein
MKKKLLIAAAILIVAGIAAFFVFGQGNSEMQFKTVKIIKGDIEAAVSATGTVNAVINVNVGTQVSGTIKKLFADFNSPVKKDQLIALIDPATFEAQVDQAKANLLSARANLEKADATLADTKRTMNRNRELFSKNLIARSELDTAETNYDVAASQVSVSKAQVAQSEAALKLAETNLRYTRIVSPVDGIVVSRNVDVGQTVAASFQTPTLFNIAQDLTKMQIDTNVDEADIGKVRVGQAVEFTVDAYPDKTFKGRVSQVRNAPITVQNVVTYDVVIYVDNPELHLKPGMTANVSIIVANKKDILKISNAALRYKHSDRGAGKPEQKGSGIWVLENKTPKRLKITTGISDGNYTELVSGEAREGQEVIVESLTKSNQQTPSRGPRLF